MVIGFTGTRQGMNDQQKEQLRLMLGIFAVAMGIGNPTFRSRKEFHHGADRDGADGEAARIAAECGFDPVPHPPKSHTAKHLLERDREVVHVSDILVAAPLTDKEQVRSGTWYTVRRAHELRRPVVHLSRGRA
jgi:hypothetical protein